MGLHYFAFKNKVGFRGKDKKLSKNHQIEQNYIRTFTKEYPYIVI